MNGRDLSGKTVKLPTAGEECRGLLTRLSSCRNLHNHIHVAVSTCTAPIREFPPFPQRSYRATATLAKSVTGSRVLLTRIAGILIPAHTICEFTSLRGRFVVGHQRELGESQVLISTAIHAQKETDQCHRSTQK